jgi:hypothetical protein
MPSGCPARSRFAALRTDLIKPALEEHRGRLVKLMGDGLLAEFASVVDAVACAVAMQASSTADLALRIGINLGDVVVEGDDLYGDGVNIAARLEGVAEPCGIVVSGTARDHLHGQPGLPSPTWASCSSRTSRARSAPIGCCTGGSGAEAPAVPPERPGSSRSASSARSATRRWTTASPRGSAAGSTGWPNRDLNVGAIIAAAPNLGALAGGRMGLSEDQLRQILLSWVPANTMPRSTTTAAACVRTGGRARR